MTIARGFIILGVCIVLFLVELLFLARIQIAIPPTPMQKVMLFVTVGTVVVGLFAPVGAIIERLGKRKGIGNYVLFAAVGVYLLYSFVF